jgi:glyoxylase-like metal-dependent hydrolase (beta-lactamase superfamily II)
MYPAPPCTALDPDDWLDAPGEVKLDTMTWQMHPAPGQTRGHVVFVGPDRDVMFASDQVLPHITLSIGFEQNHAATVSLDQRPAEPGRKANP